MEDNRIRIQHQQMSHPPSQNHHSQPHSLPPGGHHHQGNAGSNQSWPFMSSGPKMWNDKRRHLKDDFKLEYMVEYMELDEFLTENDIPLETVLQEQQQMEEEQQKRRLEQQQQSSKQQVSLVSSPTTPSSPQPPGGPLLQQKVAEDQDDRKSVVSQIIKTETSVSDQASDYATPVRSASVTPDSGLSGHASAHHQGDTTPPHLNLDLDLDLDDSSSPGSLFRKRKKQMVSEERKDEKYWERRRKNNMAAKRSRDARRAKETQIAIQATFLERENKSLAQELSKARSENNLLRERLQKYERI
jgi:thyrotrophic embryonic factor